MRWSTLRWIFQRRRNEVELDQELQSHLEQEIGNNIRSGMSRDEAKYAAQRLVGSVSLYKEECRDQHRAGFRDTVTRDLRYAIRTLRRAPLFTAIAIVTLALGIGANTTIFTFIENILLRSLPVNNPQQLVSLNWGGMTNIAYPNYADFRDRNTVFSGLIACRYNAANITVHARDNSRAWGYEASGNYFQTLGIKPALGRFFGPSEDDKPGAHPVLVISYRYWQSRFAADPNIIGRAVKVNGFPFTIIGVAQRDFSGTEFIMTADYWAPMCMAAQIEPGADWLRARSAQNLWLVGRLKPGVSRAQAEQNLNAISQDLARAYPDILNRETRFQLFAPGLIGGALRKPITGFGIVLMILAATGLLLACVNLAGMFLARGSDRSREVGIRLALGAGRVQLLRQFLTESLLLALAGALFGFLLAEAACRLFSSWHPSRDLPINTTLYPDQAVLWFTLAVALATTLLFGLVPALQAVRIDVLPTLKNEPPSVFLRKWQLRDLLVMGQIALSVVLVVSSLLVVRSLQHALSLNLGFNPTNAVSVSFDLRLQRYNGEQSRRFDANLVAKTAALPGVQSAGVINTLPLTAGGENNSVVTRVGRPIPKPADLMGAVTYNITPGYLHTAQTRLLSGRDLNGYDRKGAPPVAIVNEALVHKLFGDENPLGKHVRLSTAPADPGLEIVGVTETGKYEYLGEDPKPVIFLPVAQTGTAWTTLVVRSSLPPQTVSRLLHKTVLDLDPDLTLFDAGTLQEQLAIPLFPARIAAIALGAFGLLAIALAATGLFALMAYAVSRRTREIGIRMALGAQPAQVLASLFRRTLLFCAAGLLIGTAITLLASRLLSAVLYGVSPRDPATYLAALVVMMAVALLASWQPATRAIRTDPATTLREQ